MARRRGQMKDPKAATPSGQPVSGRIASLDALRGFDMFWITGGDAAS